MHTKILSLFFVLVITTGTISYFESKATKNSSITSPLQLSIQEIEKNLLYNESSICIEVSIHNPNNYAIRYLSMSCSYEDIFFVSDNGKLKVQSRDDCYRNVPIMEEIPANSTIKKNIKIIATDMGPQEYKKTLQIGMYLFTDELVKQYNMDSIDAYKKRTKVGEQLISNELILL